MNTFKQNTHQFCTLLIGAFVRKEGKSERTSCHSTLQARVHHPAPALVTDGARDLMGTWQNVQPPECTQRTPLHET